MGKAEEEEEESVYSSRISAKPSPETTVNVSWVRLSVNSELSTLRQPTRVGRSSGSMIDGICIIVRHKS